jgi:hypothetical protein
MMGSGWQAFGNRKAEASRVTVIYKNQVKPSVAEVEARRHGDRRSRANSDKELKAQRGAQWI